MQTINLNPNSTGPGKPWYAQLWPWLLMAGPFIVVIAACYTGWIAFSRQDPLVVDDYYKQGQAINQDLRRDHVATNLGLRFAMQYKPADGLLAGEVDATGAPSGGKILIHLIHSTQPQKDINLIAQTDSHGKFSVALPMLEIARWQVLVENEKRDWRLSGIWIWPQEQNIQIDADAAPAE